MAYIPAYAFSGAQTVSMECEHKKRAEIAKSLSAATSSQEISEALEPLHATQYGISASLDGSAYDIDGLAEQLAVSIASIQSAAQTSVPQSSTETACYQKAYDAFHKLEWDLDKRSLQATTAAFASTTATTFASLGLVLEQQSNKALANQYESLDTQTAPIETDSSNPITDMPVISGLFILAAVGAVATCKLQMSVNKLKEARDAISFKPQ